jgi:plastocyanin
MSTPRTRGAAGLAAYPRMPLGTLLLAALVAAAAALLSLTASTTPADLIANQSATQARTASHVAARQAKPTVMIKDYAFSPKALTVTVGTTVTWTNMDSAPHTVTVSSGPEKFDSGTLQKGDSFSFTFTRPGTYSYYCAVHPDMTAKVVVKRKSAPAPHHPAPHHPAPHHPAPDQPSGGHSMPQSSTTECTGVSAAERAFLTHFYAGHLEESPSQQAADIMALDQYVKTHTVLVENMLKPMAAGGDAALSAFLTHFYAGHLEESPTQQAADITATAQYVKTHTVLVENMLKPLVGSSDC